MPKVSEALYNFLQARKTAANADLVDRWSIGMEVQVNVAPGDGEPVAGKRSTWSDGINEWFNVRVPKNAATDPTFNDYNLSFPLALHAEGVGMTGWDWQARRSRHFGYDFDAITGHAKGIGIGDEERKHRNLVFHSWRRFANTYLRSRGLPDAKVRQLTRHGSESMTEHYTTWDADDFSDVAREQARLARALLDASAREDLLAPQ